VRRATAGCSPDTRPRAAARAGSDGRAPRLAGRGSERRPAAEAPAAETRPQARQRAPASASGKTQLETSWRGRRAGPVVQAGRSRPLSWFVWRRVRYEEEGATGGGGREDASTRGGAADDAAAEAAVLAVRNVATDPVLSAQHGSIKGWSCLSQPRLANQTDGSVPRRARTETVACSTRRRGA
jgi:hypothetical protein